MAATAQRKISTRLIRKGALIQETYAVMQIWDYALSVRANLDRIKHDNLIGAANESWLHEVTTTLSSRFTDHMDLAALSHLAKGGFPIERWAPCLLSYIGQVDELYYSFATEWLYQEFRAGTYLVRTADVKPFVHQLTHGRIASGGDLSDYGLTRAARDLLRMAADFGLLSGSVKKEFNAYHLPEDSFFFLLHAFREKESNAARIVHSDGWRLFLMGHEDVERELFNLHQYRKVHYEVAGSLASLDLPHETLLDCAKEMVA
jgi:hypothetical protein